MSRVVPSQQLEVQARRASQEGRDVEAAMLWAQLLEQSPDNPAALAALGATALRRGDRAQARTLLERAANAAPGDLMVWINFAMACRACGDSDGEAAAVSRALICDPMDLIALIMKARILDARGPAAEAARVHAAVLAVAPAPERLSPDLRAAVEHSRKMVEAKNRSLEAFFDKHISVPEGERPRRFNESLNILLGKQKRYTHEPVQFYYPGLAPIYFFDRAQFPWLAAFEAATDEIREEFLRVHAEDRGFSPYLTYPPGTPLNQWEELNHSDRWSAFHLLKSGERVEDNAARCPKTMSLLAQAPQPVSFNRTPNAMFSLLAPRTKIPPHTGVVNTRLVVHVPLILPEGCGFRVGNDVRQWRLGEGFVFDDTIEHEAWNDSDQLRVVLIFDVWRPDLDETERQLIVELMNVMDRHDSGEGDWGL
jgi:Flp pilus assembly protein TadD